MISITIQYENRPSTDAGAKAILKILIHRPVCVVNVGTGGGKTFMSIRAVGVYKPHAHLLVFTTKGQVKAHNWEDSIDAYNKAVTNSNLTYTVLNYEALRSKKSQQTLINKIKPHLDQPLYIIADEAHRIKNPTSKNFRHLQKLTKLPNFKGTICLTATPISESLLDTCSYLILARYYHNKTDFIRTHVIRFDKYFQPITKDHAGNIHNEWLVNYQQIIQEFKSIQVYIDTNHLKPKVIKNEQYFHFDKATQKGYRQIKKDYLNGVYDSIMSANAAQRDYIANHAEQRLTTLSKIINNPKRPSGPILIFYQFNSDLEVLKRYLLSHHSDFKLFEINGAHKYDVTQTPPEKSLFLCQYQASGEGLNAPWSHVSVFYSPTYSWERYKQAQGRNIRAYQGGTTYQIRFVVGNTINEHYWYDLIDNKRQFTSKLMKQYLTNDD